MKILIISVFLIQLISGFGIQHQFLQQNLQNFNNQEYQVYRCFLYNESTAHKVHEWVDTVQSGSNSADIIDIWQNDQFHTENDFDFALNSLNDEILESIPDECNLLLSNHQLKILIQEELSSKSIQSSDVYSQYQSHETMMTLVNSWVQQSSVIASVKTIAKTYEGREIPVVKISSPSDSNQARKVIWFNGGIHAREFISSHVALYLLQNILEGYKGGDELIVKALNMFDFHIAPHVNPDGYEYARTASRMWRKNRRVNEDGSFGVDLNRNFDIFWGQGGSSRSSWSDTYMGPSAASEPEVKALQDYQQDLKSNGKIIVGIDLHSYGQLIMRPYGNKMDDHKNEKFNKMLGDSIRDAIFTYKDKSRYTSQKSAGLYPVTGGFDDYMTEKLDAIGFTWELRDRGRFGFVLPPKYIRPTCEEVWLGFRRMLEVLIDSVNQF